MQFSALVVRLSMIMANSSSVISSRIAGPKKAGGMVNWFWTADAGVPEGCERVMGVRGDVGSAGESAGEEGRWGSVIEAADSASRRRIRVDNSLTCSISIRRDSFRIARGS